MDAGSPDGASQRSSERQLLPLGMSANLHLLSGDKVVVNLRDLSDGGVCAVRNGPVQVRVGASVDIELIDYDRGERLEVPATVRWLNAGRYSTTIGLQFDAVDPGLADFIAQHRTNGEPAA